MDISREMAIQILKYLDKHKEFYLPFLVVNKEYSEEDDDFVEVEPSEWQNIVSDRKYQTFQLWENLQKLDLPTLKLMARGFIEMMQGSALEIEVSVLARNYTKEANRRAQFSNLYKIEDLELNEFIKG